jgi:hypothetical protein
MVNEEQNSKAIEKYRKKYGLINSNKGSATIETIIIIPFIFFSLLFIIYISLKLFKITNIQVTADLTAQRGSATWGNASKNINTGKPMNIEVPLYQHLFDKQGEAKKSKLKEWVFKRLGDYCEEEIKIETKNYILFKNLRVEIAYYYSSPLKKALTKTNIKEYGSDVFRKEIITAKSTIFEPAEFIRNIDLFVELKDKLKNCNFSLESFFEDITVIEEVKNN